MPHARRTGRRAAWLALVLAAGAAAGAPPGRAVFEAHWDAALDGRWPLTAADERALEGYPLAPDLRAAWFSARLADADRDALERFMADHDGLPPIRRLRYRYALHLANAKEWRAYGRLYDTYYQGAGIAALDCLSLQGRIVLERRSRERATTELARRLWRVPASQHRHCDAAFEALLADGTLGTRERSARLAAAIEARNFSLAAYVADMIGPAAQRAVSRWRRMQRNPGAVLAAGADGFSAEQVDYGLRKLALREPLEAGAHWQTLKPGAGLTDEDAAALERHIALATAQDYHPEARALLAALPDDVADARALEWRARAAMREGDWADVVRTIARMPAADQASERWRYWEAVALVEIGQPDAGRGLLEALAGARSYHGFLAADRLGVPYQLGEAPIEPGEDAIASVAGRDDVCRAVELDAVGQRARAQYEWQLALRRLDDTALPAAAAFAHTQGWHAAAIRLLAELEAWDDLARRYPAPHVDAIKAAADGAGIPPSWALAIARSESLFDPDARSGAGAVGLMQLMPGTARRVAKRAAQRWHGNASLRDPAVSIALGTRYLGELAEEFDHPALATAAYNAGPERIPGWLPAAGPMPADLWIETIAYDETRGYVQRVLAAEIIYRHRLGLEPVRLAERLPPVAPAVPARVATRL